MRYFIPASERQGSCYFEFQPGRWRGRCWLPGSILLADERWEALRLTELFGGVLPEFDYFGVTPVSPGQWERIAARSLFTEYGEYVGATRPRRGQRPALRGTASSAFWACEWGRGCEVHWRRAATRPSSSSTARTTASSPAPWGGRTMPAAAPQIRPC